jgi:hypothetical protein
VRANGVVAAESETRRIQFHCSTRWRSRYARLVDLARGRRGAGRPAPAALFPATAGCVPKTRPFAGCAKSSWRRGGR